MRTYGFCYPSFLSAPVACVCLLTGVWGCNTDRSHRSKAKVVIQDNSSYDATSGATMLGDNDNLKPLKRYESLLDSIDAAGFVSDTVRLRRVASYAYRDLQKASFYLGKRYPCAVFTSHIMQAHLPKLNKGQAYYFVQKNGDDFGVDFGLEHWVVHDMDSLEIATLMQVWEQRIHPIPIYFIQEPDHLYVLYTRSVTFAPEVEKLLEPKWQSAKRKTPL